MNIFLNNLPSIDLHGVDRDYARILINDFIYDNYRLKNEKIVIIHGIGTGIIRKTTHEALKRNKYVQEYKTDYFNDGMTIVFIRKKSWLFKVFLLLYQLHVNRGGVEICTQKNMIKEDFHLEISY